ncbi:MAG: EFR1 family ferrodoxin [Ignavibacteria bacterium]|jgi:ferredoxin
MNFDELIIYYFSGTGNALNVARWINNITEEKNIKTTLVNLAESNRKKPVIPKENSLVGFISQTHGFNFPPLMLHFILRFPKAKNCKAFIMNTRGGLKFGKIFFPGLSGITQLFSSLVLLLKGFKIIGMRPVDLPSNWISLHPGLKDSAITSIYEKRKEEVIEFADKILDGKRDLKALKDIIQDLLISPVSVLYYLFGRFMFAKSFIASGDCNNCGLCKKECPVNAIKSIDGRPYWTHKCESCMHCMNICPKRAIETAHGFIIAMAVFINPVPLFYIYSFFNFHELSEQFPFIFSDTMLFLFDSVVFIGFLILSYRIIHFLLRFKVFEILVVYSSLTKYKFWRRYNFGINQKKLISVRSNICKLL